MTVDSVPALLQYVASNRSAAIMFDRENDQLLAIA
jgi:hypothetical protein